MNLADYLRELLGQYDEVSVPGLGYFVRMRVNAYYNDSEARFYPPYHQVKFIPQPKEDEIFVQYVADKKNISLASSKYFIEKFINKLKEDAQRGKFLFADIGSFQIEQDQLVFKPNDRIPDDPAFYGYPAIDITKPGQPLSVDQKKPVFAQTETTPAIEEEPQWPSQTIPRARYYEEETEQKSRSGIWLILLIVLASVALAIFLVYQLYPAAFYRVRNEFNKITGKTTVAPVIHYYPKVDTAKVAAAKKIVAVPDTDTKTVSQATPPDTVNQSRFEAIANEYKYLGQANLGIAHLKAAGYNAYIVLDAPGPRIKISIGAYPTYAQADSATEALFKSGKIKKRRLPLEIPKSK